MGRGGTNREGWLINFPPLKKGGCLLQGSLIVVYGKYINL